MKKNIDTQTETMIFEYYSTHAGGFYITMILSVGIQ